MGRMGGGRRDQVTNISTAVAILLASPVPTVIFQALITEFAGPKHTHDATAHRQLWEQRAEAEVTRLA